MKQLITFDEISKICCETLEVGFKGVDSYSLIGKSENVGKYETILTLTDDGKFLLSESGSALKKLSSSNKKKAKEKFTRYGITIEKNKMSVLFDNLTSLLFNYQKLCFALEQVDTIDISEEQETKDNIALLENTCGGLFKFEKYDETRIRMIYPDFDFVCDILITEIEDDKTFMLTDDGSNYEKVERMDKDELNEKLDYIKKKYGVVYNRGHFVTIVPLKQITTEFIELVQAINYVLK